MLLAACATVSQESEKQSEAKIEFDWHLPPGFAPPPVPESNRITLDKVELGRRLFYETRLSVNGQGSCESCHQQQIAFTDGRAQAIGVTGELHARSSMSLVNVAYNDHYTWASRDVQTLEQQIRIPLFNRMPIELGLRGKEEVLVSDLESSDSYSTHFERAFPESADPVSIDNIIKALASFVRTIISADSAFDRRLYRDDQSAMSESAIRGMRLFYSDELKCRACHLGQNLAGGQTVPGDLQSATEFHNTGLYNIAGRNRYPDSDPGLRLESEQSTDDGLFRAPSLRNIAITAPYMHDGSIATLSEVIDHYAAGGRTIEDGPNAGVGKKNSSKSPLLTGFRLGELQKRDLLSFLESLTDQSVLTDPRFSNPEEGLR